MKFLSKKGFNPQNMTNQKRVYEARQSKKQEDQKLRDRNEQLKRERDDEELARARGDHVRLNFLYEPPPGMEAAAAKGDSAVAEAIKSMPDAKPASISSKERDITEVQPGDDPAAIAFRKMLAAASAGEVDNSDDEANVHQQSTEQGIVFGAVMQGSSVEKDNSKGKEGLSALEKSVGRRNGNQTLSLNEQCERFPQLKNAPMAKGMNGTDVGVSFKPLGSQLRNVRCLACGIWGHSRGERECEKSGWNPFAAKRPASFPSAAKLEQADPKADNQSGAPKIPKDDGDDRSVASSSSSSEDSYRRERKRRKKSKRRHRKKESRRTRRRSRSESPSDDQKRRRRSRSESPGDRERSRKKSKKKSRR